MKLSVVLLAGLLSSGCISANPPETKFTVRVLDSDTSLPVTNAVVRTTFTQKRDPWGTGKGKFNQVKLLVDQNGKVTLSGYQGKTEKGASGRAFSDGYYTEGKGFKFTSKNMRLNRWEPWNPTVEIRMRPKKKPVAMFHREGHRNAFKVPVYDQPIGFDLEKDTFVKPHGKGSRSDLFLEFKRDFKNSQNYDVSCKVSFPKEHDGIQEYYFDETSRSSFKWPYLAPTNNYTSLMTWRSTRSDAKPVVNNFDEKRVNYIFRIRTQVDDEGNVMSACYGKVAGAFGLGWADWVNWVYWFNPVPNERSLEWNGENLLTK